MTPAASHALFFGVLLATGWVIYLVCAALERRTAARCVRPCCTTHTASRPHTTGSPR